jgi:hypothetical protein
VVTRDGLDDSEKMNTFCAYQDSKPDRPARSPDTPPGATTQHRDLYCVSFLPRPFPLICHICRPAICPLTTDCRQTLHNYSFTWLLSRALANLSQHLWEYGFRCHTVRTTRSVVKQQTKITATPSKIPHKLRTRSENCCSNDMCRVQHWNSQTVQKCV